MIQMMVYMTSDHKEQTENSGTTYLNSREEKNKQTKKQTTKG